MAPAPAPQEGQLFSLEDAYEEIVGGKRPTKNRLTVSGVKFDLKEPLKKGQLVKAEIVFRVGGKLDEDTYDSATDQVIDTTATAKGRFKSGEVIGLVGDLQPVD